MDKGVLLVGRDDVDVFDLGDKGSKTLSFGQAVVPLKGNTCVSVRRENAIGFEGGVSASPISKARDDVELRAQVVGPMLLRKKVY